MNRHTTCMAPLLAIFVAAASPAGAQTGSASPQAQIPASSPFLGSVPTGTRTAEPVQLSIKDAIDLALQHNLGLLLAEETANAAHGARWHALEDLLPDVYGTVSATRQVLNLEAFGFPAKPSIVGPFNVFDSRVTLSQPILDVTAFNDARAAGLNERAARYGIKDARDLVVLVSVNLYLEAVADQSRIEMARAQQDTADSLFRQAADLKGSGIVAGIDVLRAQVQQQTARQRVIVAQNDFEKAKLQIARALGLPPGQPVVLTDTIPFAPMPLLSLDDALKRAFETRPDYLAAEDRFHAAEATVRAAHGALLPTVNFDANFGAIGQTVETAHSTYAIGATVHVPIFESGRAQTRRVEANALVAQRRAEYADFKGRVEYEVRAALLDVHAAEDQLKVAQTKVQLATDELQQARDRFAAGVANNLEVTEAQEAVASASDTYVAALYAHNLAKATLARSLGVAEQAVTSYLGGAH